MIIRTVKQQELPFLSEFSELTFRYAWQAQNEPDAFEAYCKKAFSLERLESEVSQPNTAFYFAELEDSLVGYIKVNQNVLPEHWVSQTDRAIQLARFYVCPSTQNQGVGKALLNFVEYIAKSNEYNFIWLTVWQEAARSIEFYKKNGFEICGSSIFCLGNERQTDWVMQKQV
jgi:diamine N-acetyltransferase